MPAQLLERCSIDETINNAPDKKSGETLCTIAVFLFVVASLGLITWIVQPPKLLRVETRYRHDFPGLKLNWQSISDAPKRFEDYYNDRFAFRDAILGTTHVLKYYIFHSACTSQVVVSDNGWLDQGRTNNIVYYLNNKPFSEHGVAAIGKELEFRRAWLARRGIRYLFFLAPAKSTIYEESMPDYYRRLRNPGPTRMDQLLSYLKQYTKVETFDLRPLLIAAKGHDQIYYKADSHWTTIGGYIAYQEIIRRLRQWFPSIKEDEPPIASTRSYSGDIARNLGLEELLQEPYREFAVRDRHWVVSKDFPRCPEAQLNLKDLAITTTDDKTQPKAIILRDSFMVAPQNFLSQHFRRAVYFWTYYFPMDTINEEKPDVVIEEISEWMLQNNLPYTTTGSLAGKSCGD